MLYDLVKTIPTAEIAAAESYGLLIRVNVGKFSCDTCGESKSALQAGYVAKLSGATGHAAQRASDLLTSQYALFFP
ncbi:MAG: hypothetical protein KC448_07855 [Yoonia sp.]|nr:hypothetical protein [Yoonia sp.]